MTTEAQVLDRLYRAATTPGQWERALEAITRNMGGDCIHMLLLGERPASTVSRTWNVDESSLEYYNCELLYQDPRVAQFRQHPHRRIVYDYRHSTEAEIARDPVCAWRERDFGLRYYIGFVPHLNGVPFSYFTVQRTPAQGHVSKDEIRSLARLAPHLQRAVEIAQRLDHQALWEENDIARLDAKGCGLALLNAAGEVVQMNDTLRGLLARGDGLVFEDGMVLPRKAADRRGLLQDLGAVLSATDSGDFAAPPMRAVAKYGSPYPYLLTLAPLRGRANLILDCGHPRAMLIVHDPTAANPLDLRRVALVFQLTPQECRVAERLWQGETPKDIAATLGVSLETVRVHLKSLRRKTLSKSLPHLVTRLAAFAE